MDHGTSYGKTLAGNILASCEWNGNGIFAVVFSEGDDFCIRFQIRAAFQDDNNFIWGGTPEKT
jgi:hypothetical protein